VATDIAARGIHVDDVALVIHADPPVEHKAYLHRSGRTARAGAAGTVVTMVLDHQSREVRVMTRKAGISPVVTRADHAHPILHSIAPGERTFGAPVVAEPVEERRPRNRRPAKGPQARSTGNGSGRGHRRPQRRTTSGSHSAASFSSSRSR
jgi:superfamily II DNA/RNA helicase